MTERSLLHPKLVPAAWRCLPFGIYILFLAAGPALKPMLADGRWLYGIQVALVALSMALAARHYGELRAAPRMKAGEFLLAVLVGVGVFAFWIKDRDD